MGIDTVRTIAIGPVAPFELGVAYEVFGIDRSPEGGPRFDFAVVTATPGTVEAKGGFSLAIDRGLDDVAQADVVIVPAFGGSGASGSADGQSVEIDPAVGEALRQAHRGGAWIVSLCSGAFALGEAGLLDGRRCTTHWMHADDLQARFPSAEVDCDVLYVEDDRIITSAGTAAGIDACLHLVRCELGPAAATLIARRMVVPPHRDGGQAQYVEAPLPRGDGLAGLLDWAQSHPHEDLSVEALARRAALSTRTFARRFREETGTTPAAWVGRMRLRRAQVLLETTAAGVDEVARLSGFGDGAILRQHFARSLATSPTAYRERFAGR